MTQCRSEIPPERHKFYKEDDDMTSEERSAIISEILDLLDRLSLVTTEEGEHNPSA